MNCGFESLFGMDVCLSVDFRQVENSETGADRSLKACVCVCVCVCVLIPYINCV